jgi:hypothetical protein
MYGVQKEGEMSGLFTTYYYPIEIQSLENEFNLIPFGTFTITHRL